MSGVRNGLRIAALTAIALIACGSARAGRLRDVHAPLLARVDTLYVHGQAGAAAAFIDSVIAAARARGDASLDAAFTARRAGAQLFFRRFDDAIRDADHAIAAAREARDTLSWGRALDWKGRACGLAARAADATASFRELLLLGQRCGDPVLIGNARMGLASADLEAERLASAEAGFRAAVRWFAIAGDTRSGLSARVGLARALRHRGRPREAQAMYREVIRSAHAIGDLRNEADAWNNLGVIEMTTGDPARAADDFQRALELNRTLGRETGTQVHNLALLLIERGEFRKAKTQLERELSRPEYAVLSETGYRLRTKLGVTLSFLNMSTASTRLLGGLWAKRDSVSQEAGVDAGLALANALRGCGRDSESLAVLEQMLKQYGPTLPADSRAAISRSIALAQCRLGRLNEAVRIARRAFNEAPSGADPTGTRLLVGSALLQCELAAGMGDSARALAFALGHESDRLRAASSTRDWQVSLGANASELSVLTARALLDSTRAGDIALRAGECFDALQRYKGRHSISGGTRSVTAAQMSASTLRAGDVFLDLYWNSTDSSLAAITLAHGNAAFARVTHALDPIAALRIGRLYAARDGADAAERRIAARAQLERLFGRSLDAVLAARRVYVSPPSWLAAFPLAAILDELRPNLAREVVIVPSAGWLAGVHEHPVRLARPARIAVLSRERGEDGKPMAGVREEVRWLIDHYGATGFENSGGRSLDLARPWLTRGDVLHVAAHSHADAFDPWGSAMLLGRGESDEAWLTSREIAEGSACAPLVVLATCNATMGSNLGNESVYGLASAFVSAGARTVISTLWDADDRATARFTRLFYGSLEHGRTAGAALREAQLSLAADAATHAPYYWAGFVLVGDPDLRVPIVATGGRGQTRGSAAQSPGVAR